MYMDEFILLDEIEGRYSGILQDNLVGIYVHGSIAFRCFNWNKSDIDFVVVVKKPLTLEQKMKMISMILAETYSGPKKGFEMSVVLAEHCRHFVYPTPYELHFSNRYIDIATEDLKSYCESSHGVDKDLAAHFTIIKALGITICGKSIDKVFGTIPKAAYLSSIKYDVKGAEGAVQSDPINVILNLCRVMAYVQDEKILSKEGGGEWGIKHLPEVFQPLIKDALECYKSYTKTMNPDPSLAKRFVQFMEDLINQ